MKVPDALSVPADDASPCLDAPPCLGAPVKNAINQYIYILKII
jgi:hypothetical protein